MYVHYIVVVKDEHSMSFMSHLGDTLSHDHPPPYLLMVNSILTPATTLNLSSRHWWLMYLTKWWPGGDAFSAYVNCM